MSTTEDLRPGDKGVLNGKVWECIDPSQTKTAIRIRWSTGVDNTIYRDTPFWDILLASRTPQPPLRLDSEGNPIEKDGLYLLAMESIAWTGLWRHGEVILDLYDDDLFEYCAPYERLYTASQAKERFGVKVDRFDVYAALSHAPLAVNFLDRATDAVMDVLENGKRFDADRGEHAGKTLRETIVDILARHQPIKTSVTSPLVTDLYNAIEAFYNRVAQGDQS